MGLMVQKFGGSVLTDLQAFGQAAGRVARTVDAGFQVIAVVSARKGVTDGLLRGASRLTERPTPESLDLLLATGELQSLALLNLALHGAGIDSKALNPWQLGLHTDTCHGRARITRVNPLPIRAALSNHPAVIVPGFVGRGEDHGLTTLGRGGSDLTAVALAHAFKAETCAFFKDVPGYFSADPHLVPDARHRPLITSAEALELSRFGCRFLQDRAIQRAVRTRCCVELRALSDDERATRIMDHPPPAHPAIAAMTHKPRPAPHCNDEVLISLVGLGLLKDKPFRAEVEGRLKSLSFPAALTDRSPLRLTLSVKAGDAIDAQREIHEKCILDLESKPLESH